MAANHGMTQGSSPIRQELNQLKKSVKNMMPVMCPLCTIKISMKFWKKYTRLIMNKAWV